MSSSNLLKVASLYSWGVVRIQIQVCLIPEPMFQSIIHVQGQMRRQQEALLRQELKKVARISAGEGRRDISGGGKARKAAR